MAVVVFDERQRAQREHTILRPTTSPDIILDFACILVKSVTMIRTKMYCRMIVSVLCHFDLIIRSCDYFLFNKSTKVVLGGGPIYQKQVPKADRKSGKVGVVLARNS